MIKTEQLAKLFLQQGGSIVDYMKSLNMDSSKTNRAKLAKEYGIENYSGTAEQNMKLLSLMKAGNKRSTSTQNQDPDNKQVTHITTKSKTTPESENEKSWLGTLWDKGINYLNSKIDLSKYIDDSSTQPVTTQGNTGAIVPNVDKTDKQLVQDLLGTVSSDLIGTTNPEMSPGTQLSQQDKQYIKALQAAYGIPVTGDLDDTTLEMFRYKNSITGKVNDLYQQAVKGGSTARQFINFGVRTALPFLPTKELRRDDFTDGQQRHFDKILTQAFNAKDGVYQLSGGMYSDGYAKGHKGHDNSFIATGTRILSGNDQTDAAYSVGGGAVRVATLPNGRRAAMITDVYDFNNDKGTDTDLTTLQGVANIANKLTVRPSSNTKYALYEDGTPVSEEDIQIVYNLGEDFLKSTTKRPLLARHVPNLGYKATTWTGKGNK